MKFGVPANCIEPLPKSAYTRNDVKTIEWEEDLPWILPVQSHTLWQYCCYQRVYYDSWCLCALCHTHACTGMPLPSLKLFAFFASSTNSPCFSLNAISQIDSPGLRSRRQSQCWGSEEWHPSTCRCLDVSRCFTWWSHSESPQVGHLWCLGRRFS